MKRRLTYEDHIKLGEELQHSLCRFHQVFMSLQRTYGKSAQCTVRARQVLRAIDELRCELDDRACAESPRSEYPEREPHRLYYGKGIVGL